MHIVLLIYLCNQKHLSVTLSPSHIGFTIQRKVKVARWLYYYIPFQHRSEPCFQCLEQYYPVVPLKNQARVSAQVTHITRIIFQVQWLMEDYLQQLLSAPAGQLVSSSQLSNRNFQQNERQTEQSGRKFNYAKTKQQIYSLQHSKHEDMKKDKKNMRDFVITLRSWRELKIQEISIMESGRWRWGQTTILININCNK